ncbi:uncharacterized protein ELE39_000975 [Cryptosporidium sp. chipmunk genotype I]|uniref:uncharacterized protein n=1 Tax=Cryptosporidium sp. chipmunk genotype I TaxID=1280935 RepID=UPI00351A83B1|nr:hypothetical protein ELE39_000975 [Cryptosporidium sp. chipmunk genotype I]
MENSLAIHPLKKKLGRVLELKLGENEELINGLISLDTVDEVSEGIPKHLVTELLSTKGQNKCRSMQLLIYKYHLTVAENCLDSLRPFVEDLRAMNNEIKSFEKEFNENVTAQLTSWHKFSLPLLEEFNKIQDQIQMVENKRNMCNAMLSHLSTNFVGDIKNLKSSMDESKGNLLLSLVAIYNKCMVSETNSKKLIKILASDSREAENTSEFGLSRLKNDSEYSSMIPQILINLKALILDLELKRSQLASEITSFLVELVISKSPDEFNDQFEQSQNTDDETEGTEKGTEDKACVFRSQSFQEAVEILELYHKEQCCSLLTCVIETRSKYLEYRFNHIIGHGISIGDNNYSSNLLDYLESIFEWVRVCGVSIESEFLIKAFGYQICEDCEFEEKHLEFNQNETSAPNSLDSMAKNILNRITHALCIPFSGAIRDILRQFHPPQTSRPDSTHHFGNLTSLKTGITIGIKISHLINNYVEALIPMFKILPKRFSSTPKEIRLAFPLLIQRFKDLREEAIAQYYVYAGIVKENISSRISEIITTDFSISLLVMEWSSLLKDILSTIQSGVLTTPNDHTPKIEDINSTLISMLDTFINPMFNAICSVTTSDKTPLTSIIRINNINYCLSILTAFQKMKILLEKQIEIANQIINDEVSKLTALLKEEFCDKYRFGELLKELEVKKEGLTNLSTAEESNKNNTNPGLKSSPGYISSESEPWQDPLLILSQVIIDQFFESILRFGAIPFANADRIQDQLIRNNILKNLFAHISRQYELIFDQITLIWPQESSFLKRDPQQIKLIFSSFTN